MVKIRPSASFPDLRLAKVSIVHGRHLPSWEAAGAIYHIALHLADSVPQTQLDVWRAERERLTVRAREDQRPLSAEESGELKAAYEKHVERYLAAGYGECLLRNAEAAQALASVLDRFDGEQYVLHEWCIMPNHVHIIVGGFPPEIQMRNVLATWKRVSGHAINRMIGRSGEVWHKDGYTRIIRDRAEYGHQMSYVWNNPELAGLAKGFLRKKFVGTDCP